MALSGRPTAIINYNEMGEAIADLAHFPTPNGLSNVRCTVSLQLVQPLSEKVRNGQPNPDGQDQRQCGRRKWVQVSHGNAVCYRGN